MLRIITRFISEGYAINYGGTDEKEAKIDIQFDIKQTRLVISALESILGYLKEQPEAQEQTA